MKNNKLVQGRQGIERIRGSSDRCPSTGEWALSLSRFNPTCCANVGKGF